MTDKVSAIYALVPKASFNTSGGKVFWHDNRPQPTEEEIKEKIAELQAAEPLRLLRQQRDQKLALTDWMAVSDRTMTPAQIDYRQTLRDMPTDNPDVALNEAGELINVTWPTEPTT